MVDNLFIACYNEVVQKSKNTLKGGVYILNYNIIEVQSQEILPHIAEKMRYKTELLPYISKAYIKRYKHLKGKNEAEKEIIRRANNRIENLKNCSTNIFTDEEGNILASNSCHQRLCPICNYKKSTITWHKINSIVEMLPDKKWILITLTVKNVKSKQLDNAINSMLKSFRRMINRNTWKKSIKGGFRSLEVTYNAEKDSYHPHIHILCCVDSDYFTTEKYIDFDELRQMWQQSAKLDYHCNVDIRAIKEAEKKNAVAEVAKYAVELSSVLEGNITAKRQEAIETIFHSIHGRRLIAMFGAVKAKAKELLIDLDSEEESTTGTMKYFIEWTGNRYEKKNI